MGFSHALFVRPESVAGYDCALCMDVVEEPTQCLTHVHFCRALAS
jgi:hypothetical protein